MGLIRMSDIKETTAADIARGNLPDGWDVDLMRYRVERVVYGHKNGCCAKLPILITVNEVPARNGESARLNYSAQCACGGWCTSGQRTPQAALDQYDRMTYRKIHNLPGEYDSAITRGYLDMNVVRAEVAM